MRILRRFRVAGLVGATAWLMLLASATLAAAAPPPGPPYPDAVTGQRVYDYAGIFSPGAIASAEATIKAIEVRTGAQVAVYTQVKMVDSQSAADDAALARLNQWGVRESAALSSRPALARDYRADPARRAYGDRPASATLGAWVQSTRWSSFSN